MKKKTGKDWYQETTNKILALLEEGRAVWLCPFPRNGGFRNTAGHHYRGVNQLYMLIDCMTNGWGSEMYVTASELKKRKLSFKGKTSCPVLKWVPVKRSVEVEDRETGEKTEETVSYMRMKYVGNVFNISQFPELLDEFHPSTSPEDVIDAAQRIIDDMPNRPNTTHAPGQAFYCSSTDVVNVPSLAEHVKQSSAEEYYSTAFHEYAHSTGHPSRLNRKHITEIAAFGSETYSKEELIAEFTAAFLCGECGIGERTIANSAAYIAGWKKVLKDNKRIVVDAIQNAQHAADYILNRRDAAQ